MQESARGIVRISDTEMKCYRCRKHFYADEDGKINIGHLCEPVDVEVIGE